MSYFQELKTRQQQAEDLASQAVELARKKGADEVKVSMFSGKGVEVSTRHCEIENLEFNQDQSMDVIIYKNKANGRASTSDFSLEAIEAAVDAALSLCEHTSPDEYAGLCDEDKLFKGERDLDLVFEALEDPDEIVRRAIDFEKLGLEKLQAAGLKDSDGAGLENSYSIRTMATHHGFVNSMVESYAAKSIGMIGESDGTMQRAGSYSINRDYKKLWSDERVVNDAVEKTSSRLGATQVPTGNYPIILTQRAAHNLFSCFSGAISGRAIYRRSSFLVDSLGKDVFPEFLNIKEDPWVKAGLASSNFDTDGAATKPQDIIVDGKLCLYLLGTYSARRLHMEPNAHNGSSYNWFVTADAEHTRSFDGLLQAAGRGLVIDQLMGQGINLVNGNYSRGASGYYFENGKRVHAVDEITIAGNLKDMFKSIALVGDDYDERSSLQSGSLLLEGMTVSGTNR